MMRERLPCLGARKYLARCVDPAAAAARRRRACVTSLDDRVRATRRSAIVASYTALRHEVQGAQHEAQEIVLRMRTAARDKRRGVLAWTLEIRSWGTPSGGVRVASADTACGGYAAAALESACRCSRGRREQRPYWYHWYTVGGSGAPDWRRC